MPITTWKILVRRAEQVGYHYSATHNTGRVPSVGERIDLTVGGPPVGFTVAEVFKDHMAKGGIEVFTVMVDETATVADPETADESP